MYRDRLEKDLKHWSALGIIAQDAPERLLAEYDARESAFSVGGVLMIIAALLVSAAVLLLVASNWEAIPRIVRLSGIVVLIWGAYVGAALLISRDLSRLAACLLVIGTLAFGGAIALVGQMYHLSGDAMQAMLTWFAGAVLVAALFRSGAVTAIAGFLAFAVASAGWSLFSSRHESMLMWLMPLMAVAVVLLVRYTGAARVRHLAYLLLVAWIVLIYTQFEGAATAILITLAGAICYLVATLPFSPLFSLARSAGAAPAFYSYLVTLAGLATLHVEFDDVSQRLAIGVITLVIAIGGIALSGKENGAVRYLGYITIAVETLYLASETIGSIIGTSGFFLVSGLVVALVAWAVITLEKRFSAQQGKA
jgi:uncharacterized membrane protein